MGVQNRSRPLNGQAIVAGLGLARMISAARRFWSSMPGGRATEALPEFSGRRGHYL